MTPDRQPTTASASPRLSAAVTSDRGPSAPPALVVTNISKRFGKVVAVKDVSFELDGAEILALVGPSGCGKSTLLRSIAGLYAVDQGSISIGDTVVDDGQRHQPPERRGVGLVFQEHALFPHLSVAENVGFGLRYHRAPNDRINETLDLIDLADKGQRFPHELSGGERQRVALARALAPRPKLMLLDEPFASLDPNLRTQVRADVINILRTEGTAAVFVTHDQSEALAIGDRIAVMDRGRFEHLASPEVVFHQPATRFTAAFMGEAAFLPVVKIDGTTTYEFGPIDTARRAPDEVVAMLRPDDVTFEVDPAGEAAVIAAEFRGSQWSYTLRLPSGAVVQSTRSHLTRVEVGTRVVASIVAGHVPVLIAT